MLGMIGMVFGTGKPDISSLMMMGQNGTSVVVMGGKVSVVTWVEMLKRVTVLMTPSLVVRLWPVERPTWMVVVYGGSVMVVGEVSLYGGRTMVHGG